MFLTFLKENYLFFKFSFIFEFYNLNSVEFFNFLKFLSLLNNVFFYKNSLNTSSYSSFLNLIFLKNFSNYKIALSLIKIRNNFLSVFFFTNNLFIYFNKNFNFYKIFSFFLIFFIKIINLFNNFFFKIKNDKSTIN